MKTIKITWQRLVDEVVELAVQPVPAFLGDLSGQVLPEGAKAPSIVVVL